MLEKLPSDQSLKLKKLLNELERLGIPSEKIYPEKHTGSSRTRCAIRLADDNKPFTRDISLASFESINEVLQAEPDCVVLVVLRYHEWPWQETFLSKCGVKRRRMLLEELTRQGEDLPPKVIATVIEEFAVRLGVKSGTRVKNEAGSGG